MFQQNLSNAIDGRERDHAEVVSKTGRTPSVLGSEVCLARKRKPVLIVDDDHGLLRSLRRLLSQHGFESIAFDSAESFRKYDDIESALCLIIDINLNGESGVDVVRHLRGAGVKIPVIVMTGNDDGANHSAAIATGCLAYLSKPFPSKLLIHSLTTVSAGEPA